MCLLLVAHDCYPGYRLIVAANRDEYHARPTAAAEHWHDHPEILAGRDLESGGTWFGVHQIGRFAAVTNVRSDHAVRSEPRSRGLIVTDFLQSDTEAPEFSTSLASRGLEYNGFNFIAQDGERLCWYSNQAEQPRTLDAGVFTISNAQLDTRWPKTERLRKSFATVTQNDGGDLIPELLDILRDAQRAPDDDLPDTGVGQRMESALSSIFIEGAHYGTRCSTVLTVDNDDNVQFSERRYDASAICTGNSHFAFELNRTTP